MNDRYKEIITYAKLVFNLDPEREYPTLSSVLEAGSASFDTAGYHHGATFIAEQLAIYLDKENSGE